MFAIKIDGFKREDKLLMDSTTGKPLLFDTYDDAKEEIRIAQKVGYALANDCEPVAYGDQAAA